MPKGKDVRPAKWSRILDLYDDGIYSAIWGRFDGSALRRLGVRWNGQGSDIGYPSQGGNSLWYAEPDFLVLPVLFKLLEASLSDSQNINNEQVENIHTAIYEVCKNKREKV